MFHWGDAQDKHVQQIKELLCWIVIRAKKNNYAVRMIVDGKVNNKRRKPEGPH